jgi:HIRAN domain
MGRDAIVAGTGFEGRADVIRFHVRAGMRVQLKREPGNPHDANAIAVFISVPVLFGLLGKRPMQIGYVKAAAASTLAEKMDAGVEITGFVKSFYAPKGREHPRVSLRLEWPDS